MNPEGDFGRLFWLNTDATGLLGWMRNERAMEESVAFLHDRLTNHGQFPYAIRSVVWDWPI